MFILEVKTQNVAGSVDEKLQTCDFKKKQYQKLLSQLNMEVQYIYILDDWFKKPQYKEKRGNLNFVNFVATFSRQLLFCSCPSFDLYYFRICLAKILGGDCSILLSYGYIRELNILTFSSVIFIYFFKCC